MADNEDGEEETLKIKDSDEDDFAEELGDSTTCVVQNCYATDRPLTLRIDIKSFIRGVQSRARCAISSLTMGVGRILFLKYLWTT